MTLGGCLKLTKIFISLYNTPVHRFVTLPVFCIWITQQARYSLSLVAWKTMSASHIKILNINSATARASDSYHCSCSWMYHMNDKMTAFYDLHLDQLGIFQTNQAMRPCFPAFRVKSISKLVKAIFESKSQGAMLRQHIQRQRYQHQRFFSIAFVDLWCLLYEGSDNGLLRLSHCIGFRGTKHAQSYNEEYVIRYEK